MLGGVDCCVELTEKAPYKFESISPQRRVRGEPATLDQGPNIHVLRLCRGMGAGCNLYAPTEHLRLVGPEATQNDVQAAIKLRGADVYARFLIPLLRPGTMVLDCGCGAGTITLGLAEVVREGHVVGVYLDPRRGRGCKVAGRRAERLVRRPPP